MRLQKFLFFLIFTVAAIIFSCSNPAEIGAELLEEDRVDLLFTNEIPVEAKTVMGVPIQTFSISTGVSGLSFLPLNRAFFGAFRDPIFGLTSASVYTQATLSDLDPPFGISKPRIDTINSSGIDSVVLTLAYDSLGGYGNITETFGIEVLFLEEVLDNTQSYLSDQTFQTATEPVGSIEFTPDLVTRPRIIDYIIDPSGGDTVSTDPHVRIHLDPIAIANIIGGSDSVVLMNDIAFWEAFRGIHIRPSRETAGLLSFDFNSDFSSINLYYQDEETPREYRFELNRIAPSTQQKTARVANIAYDYANSEVESVIDSEENGENIYLQGLNGLNAEISFPDVANFQDIVVNKAELIFTVANADTAEYLLPPQLIGEQKSSEDRQIIDDIQGAIFSNQLNQTVFGGFPIEAAGINGNVIEYRINISRFFQRVVEGSSENGFILALGAEFPLRFLELLPKPANPSRVVFFGPNHPQYPLRLDLTYTEL